MVIVLSLTFIIRTLLGFYFLESVPDGLKIFLLLWDGLSVREVFGLVDLYMESHTYGNH